MADMKKLLHAFDEADEILNSKIERTNLSTIVASATASVENKKTVSIRGTGHNIEVLKVGGRTVQDGVPTPDAPVDVKGVGDYDEETGKYKIPVSCNGEITNIYLDSPVFEGESADLIGGTKSTNFDITVLTGDEPNWQTDKAGLYRVAGAINSVGYTSPGFCTHFPKLGSIYNELYDSGKVAYNNSTQAIIFSYPEKTTLDDFRAFVRDQYSKGSPITVISVKTTADTESFDAPPIPTTSDNNELTIDTEVTPSSIDITSFGDYYSKAEVDAMVPRIAMLTYVGTGGTNTIKFPRFPTRIISMSGMTIDNNYIQSYPYDPKRVDSIKSKYYGGHMGEVSCSLSYDESESSITLTGGVDDGARFNVLGETYIVIYTY